MILPKEKFNKLLVITESGQVLGKINSFDFDTIEQKIIKYYIKPNLILRKFSTFIIDRSQILDINEQRILVCDSVLKSKVGEEEKDNKLKEKIPAVFTETK